MRKTRTAHNCEFAITNPFSCWDKHTSNLIAEALTGEQDESLESPAHKLFIISIDV